MGSKSSSEPYRARGKRAKHESTTAKSTRPNRQIVGGRRLGGIGPARRENAILSQFKLVYISPSQSLWRALESPRRLWLVLLNVMVYTAATHASTHELYAFCWSVICPGLTFTRGFFLTSTRWGNCHRGCSLPLCTEQSQGKYSGHLVAQAVAKKTPIIM